MAWDESWTLFGTNTSINWTLILDNATQCPPELTAAMHSAWVYKYFGECVMNVRQWFAFIIGMLSIACWLVAQVPQLVTNCRTGKGDEALSFWFLMLWILGDSANLIGALLTKQLATEIATAVYYLALDVVTMSQYLFYVIRNQGCRGLKNAFICQSDKSKEKDNTLLSLLLPLLMTSVFVAVGAPHLALYRSQDIYATPRRAGRTLMHWNNSIININNKLYVAGYIFGVFSAGFYVFARIPQIVKNFMRCSVEGLSVHMFILSILGNVTYGLGILLYSVDGVFLLQKLPWLIGSLGTMIFDITIIVHIAMSKTCRQCVKRSDGDTQPLLETGGVKPGSAADESRGSAKVTVDNDTVQNKNYEAIA